MFTAGGVSVGSSSSLHFAVDSFPCRDCGQWTSWAFERSWFWLCPCSSPRATLPVTNLPCFHWILRHGEWRALMSQIAYAQDLELRTQDSDSGSGIHCPLSVYASNYWRQNQKPQPQLDPFADLHLNCVFKETPKIK